MTTEEKIEMHLATIAKANVEKSDFLHAISKTLEQMEKHLAQIVDNSTRL